MDEQRKTSFQLSIQVQAAMAKLKIHSLNEDRLALQKQSESADFWNDTKAAQEVMKSIAKLKARTKPWLELESQLNDLMELAALKDESMHAELEIQLQAISKCYEDLKETLKLNGIYDDYDAIVSIYAGAGGTDAQDWAQMLLRMYSRYFEKIGWQVATIDESSGDEAGIKSITMEVSGSFVFGKLKSENGVHRLVRLSPFNSDNLRQTSFAKVEIIPKIDRPDEISIDEKELKVDVYRSGGHGGQSVNTTDSAVRITHIPSGLTVAIQNERSQLQNRETAMTILRSRLAQLQLEQHQESISQLRGPNQSAEWGNQIRSYVLHPYKQVKDLRTRYESSDPDSVLDGALEPFIDAYLEQNIEQQV